MKEEPKSHFIKTPFGIPFSGWKTIILRLKDQLNRDNTSIVSAGVAFYSFLAIFPAIIALVSIYGLAVSPEQIESQLTRLSAMMPQQAFEILKGRLENLLETSGKTLGWGMIAGLLFSIWSASRGTKSMFTGVNIAYDTGDNRSFLKQNALTLVFTFGAIILVILSMALIVAFPSFIHRFGLPDNIEALFTWLRWVILGIILIFSISLLYKLAPARPNPKFRWIFFGAALSTVLWLLVSWAFSFYVKNFSTYGEIYGSISAVVVLMLWLFITSFIILLGAELNSEIEKYTGNHWSIDQREDKSKSWLDDD
ncbi:YihY/virulence factor BrkB family protein [Salegentibacter chungangensis]|uniref:YihY/virulence factor BrkB family protein n=1 Tax=Salegentibacter chungangensis TaxID=1335724 RepID=A0ABW3NQ79_9FLAO